MEWSEGSSCSNSNSTFRRNYSVSAIPCHCSRASIVLKAWTDDNPGRRFHKCGGKMNGGNKSCDFFRWADEEKPHGWQKASLLEARDQIRQQKEEIKLLKDELKMAKAANPKMELGPAESVEKFEMADLMKKFEEEKRALVNEAVASEGRERLLRQFVVLSWGGFIVVTALMLNMVKKF